MVFATVALGEQTRDSLMHLLNDIRNLNQKIYVYTDIEIDNRFQFDNAIFVKCERKWTDFRRFELYKYIFENTEESTIYYMDCDSRLFNHREEQYDHKKFEALIDSLDFDIMSSWGLGQVVNVRWHLRRPEPGENKTVRNYTYGHEEVISYLKSKLPNYEDLLEKEVKLESVLILKKSKRIIEYFNEIITIGNLIQECDEKINRQHVAHGCGFCMSLFSDLYSINIKRDFICANFFKPNFLREIFLWGWNMEKSFKIFN